MGIKNDTVLAVIKAYDQLQTLKLNAQAAQVTLNGAVLKALNLGLNGPYAINGKIVTFDSGEDVRLCDAVQVVDQKQPDDEKVV